MCLFVCPFEFRLKWRQIYSEAFSKPVGHPCVGLVLIKDSVPLVLLSVSLLMDIDFSLRFFRFFADLFVGAKEPAPVDLFSM